MGYGKEPGAYLAPDRIRDIIRYTIMYYLLNFDTYNINTIKPVITVRNYHAFEKESGTEYRIKRTYCGIENLHDCTERIVSMLMYHMSIVFDSSRTFTECDVKCDIEQIGNLRILIVRLSLW